MSKLLIAAASLAVASAAVSNAAITGSWTTDNAEDGVFAGTWDNVGGLANNTISGNNWTASLDAGTTIVGALSVSYVSLDGQHLVAPHPGEGAPSPSFLGAAVFTGGVGSGGSAFGDVPHGSHADVWDMVVKITGPTTASIDITVNHVPEPATYGLIAGLGLVGFGLYRRSRG
jgi:hypothetical protein